MFLFVGVAMVMVALHSSLRGGSGESFALEITPMKHMDSCIKIMRFGNHFVPAFGLCCLVELCMTHA